MTSPFVFLQVLLIVAVIASVAWGVLRRRRGSGGTTSWQVRVDGGSFFGSSSGWMNADLSAERRAEEVRSALDRGSREVGYPSLLGSLDDEAVSRDDGGNQHSTHHRGSFGHNAERPTPGHRHDHGGTKHNAESKAHHRDGSGHNRRK